MLKDNETYRKLEEEVLDIQFYPCPTDYDVEDTPRTPTGIPVLNIPNKDNKLFGYDWPVYGIHDRLSIECSISGDPDDPKGVLVILADMLVPGKRLLVPFDSVEYAKKDLARLIYDFVLL